ncbi:MAG: polymerase, sigma-24 subunit, subfamily [Actinomycetia bacterium]|nr:polymerase, sigma-24 subunit, subfamily [Actinomycetes bacterium]
MRHAREDEGILRNQTAPPCAPDDVHGVASPSSTFDQVYEAHRIRLVRTAALITGSPDVAEELVHEAFVELLRRWGDVEQVGGWLRIAVVNRCRSWQRRHILERQRAPLADLVVHDPDGLAVRAALAVLSPRQRAAVVLRYFDDLSEADIAVALGCRPGTVKSLLARSMPKLQEALRD